MEVSGSSMDSEGKIIYLWKTLYTIIELYYFTAKLILLF